MKRNFFLMILFVMALSACGSQPSFEGMSASAQNDCAAGSATSSDYTACVERSEMNARRYEQDRRERDDQGR